MRIIYIANDGKEFSNKMDCIKYEAAHPSFKTLIFDGVITGYDESGVKLDNETWLREDALDEWVERAFFLRLTRDLTVNEKDSCYIQYGAHFPVTNKGLYRWNTDTTDWVDYQTDFVNFKKKWFHLEDEGI